MVSRILESLGYNTLGASRASRCLEIAKKYDGPIHLLLSDVVMPEMNGKELYEEIVSQYPDIKVLFMSGYTDDVIVDRGILKEGTNLIQKPFSKTAIAARVREILDA